MGQVHTISLVQSLAFGQIFNTNQHVRSLFDSLPLIDNDNEVDSKIAINQKLTITQSGKYSVSGTRVINQTLTFSQKGQPTTVQQLYQNLNYTQSTDSGLKWKTVFQSLIYIQNTRYSDTAGGFHVLTFNQNATISAFRRNFHITDTLNFATFPATIYKPTQGFSAGPVYPITVQRQVTFTANGKTVSLRPPEFGNTDSVDLRRIQRETRGGDLVIYRDPAWSTSEVFSLDFNFILDSDADNMRNFIQNNIGIPVIFVDHENNSWYGIFQSPDFEVKTPGRFNNAFTIKFEVIPNL